MTSRRERRQNKSKKPADANQKNWLMWAGAAIVIVAVVIVAVVAISPSDDPAEVEQDALVTGGSLIGSPDAPLTLVEFGDFQ